MITKEVGVGGVLNIIFTSKSYSPIDPIPLSLFHKLKLKQLLLTLFILNIINISLRSDIVH